ncbi:Protein of unknown function DUF3108 [Desulfovibrio sp. X2]|nr:Protein of unknown function DUF3108 [Desulfovibrio sp. X2]
MRRGLFSSRPSLPLFLCALAALLLLLPGAADAGRPLPPDAPLVATAAPAAQVYVPSASRGLDAERANWFKPGERFDYNVRWGPFDVGSATIEVLPTGTVNGKPARGFRMTARTNDFADVFYKVRDVNESWTDMDMQGSLLYLTKQHEGSYVRDYELRLYADKGTAELWSNETGKHKNTVHIFPGTMDPLSVLFAFRAWPEEFHPGMVIRQAVTDGKKFVLGEATVVRREKVKVPAGEYDCYLVEPDIRDLGGVFRKSPEAALQIWVTADSRRLPVLVRSKVVVGHFVAEMTEYKD